jgi:hypothetical protein
MLVRILEVRAARLSDARDNAPARLAWREIVELRREMRANARARTPDSATGLAYAYEMVGDSSAGLRDLPSMLVAYGDAVPLRREALAAAPNNKAARASLAAVLHALGLSRNFDKDAAGAEEALDEAARIRTALADADANDRAIAFLAVDSLQQLALVQAASDGDATRRSLEQAKAILERLVAAEPKNARYADSLQRTNGVLASISLAGR